jgi:signal recognition particle GTPase
LILAEAIKNPNKFKQLGRETIEEAIREKYNIGSNGNYYPTALMKSDAIDAIEIVQGVKKDVETVKNPFTFAKELKAQSEKTLADRQTLALGEAQIYSKQLKELPYRFGDSEVSLKVSNEEIDEILASPRASFLGRAFDTTTKEGKQAVREWLSYEVLVHKLQNGDLGVQIAKSLSAQVEKKVVKEVYNGQPKTVNRVDKTTVDTKGLTPAQQDLLARGISLPSQKLKSVE